MVEGFLEDPIIELFDGSVAFALLRGVSGPGRRNGGLFPFIFIIVMIGLCWTVLVWSDLINGSVSLVLAFS